MGKQWQEESGIDGYSLCLRCGRLVEYWAVDDPGCVCEWQDEEDGDGGP